MPAQTGLSGLQKSKAKDRENTKLREYGVNLAGFRGSEERVLLKYIACMYEHLKLIKILH